MLSKSSLNRVLIESDRKNRFPCKHERSISGAKNTTVTYTTDKSGKHPTTSTASFQGYKEWEFEKAGADEEHRSWRMYTQCRGNCGSEAIYQLCYKSILRFVEQQLDLSYKSIFTHCGQQLDPVVVPRSVKCFYSKMVKTLRLRPNKCQF